MSHYNGKKIVAGIFAMTMAVTLTQPMFAEELNTEIPSAGASMVIDDYISNNGSDEDLVKYLPAAEKTENKTNKVTKNNDNRENKLFSDIAIAKVSGGSEDYVNVRKKASAKSRRVGKIYNNCGARILETTKSGWYKIKSGNCTGYIKSEYFVTGNKAESIALDNGYVFANIKESGVHVREKTNTDSGIVTNVYLNEDYTIKKYNNDGKWVKVKIADGVSGWVSADYVKVSVNMETAITNAEERAMIKAQKAQEKRERQAAAEKANSQSNNNTNNTNNTNKTNNTNNNTHSNTNNNNTYTAPKTTKPASNSTSHESSGSGASAVVAYAKQFLGNPYVYGGSSLTNGTDCSGFTMSVYAHFGYSLNRSSYTQVYNGKSVSLSALLPGDLLFYKYNSSTISHVAMYIGGGQIIHASTEETGIIISGMGSPCAARRIIY